MAKKAVVETAGISRAVKNKITRRINAMRAAKAEIAEQQVINKEAQQEAMDLMLENELTTIVVETEDGTEVRGTIVAGVSVTIDDEGLKDAIGTALWNKVSRRVLDKAALEEAVARGDISAAIVAEYSTEKENAPYLKLTESKSDKQKGK